MTDAEIMVPPVLKTQSIKENSAAAVGFLLAWEDFWTMVNNSFIA